MLKEEFIDKIKNEVKVNNNKVLNDLLDIVVSVLTCYPNDIEIDETLTIGDCYNEMRLYAEKKQEDGCYVFSISEVEDFVRYYLKLKKIEYVNSYVNLEDFI